MSLSLSRSKFNNHLILVPKGIILEEDSQIKNFEFFIKQWIDGKITYDQLLLHVPDYDDSMLKKIIKFILSMVN